MRLERSYNIFKYERTSTESRGLPHIDKFKPGFKQIEIEDNPDSTDRSVEGHIQQHLQNATDNIQDSQLFTMDNNDDEKTLLTNL